MAANLLASLVPLLYRCKYILLYIKISSISCGSADNNAKILWKYACSYTLEAFFLLIGANLPRKEDL